MEDEELEQPKNKITLSSFFESIAAVEKVANNALSIANSNLNIIQEQKSLIDALSMSIEGLRADIQEVNNYITIQKDETSDKLVETRDDKQKQMISERLQGLQGEKGEKGDVGASGQGMSASEERMSASKEKKELEEFVNQVIDKREQKKENERKDELREKEDAEQKKEQSEKLQNKSQGGQQAGVGAVGDFDIGDSAPLNNQGGEKKGLMKFLKNPLAMKLAAGAGLLSAGALIPNLFPSTVNKQERKTIQSIDKIGKESTVDELQKIVDKPSIMDRITGRHAEAKEQLYFIEEGKTKGYGYDFEQNPRTYDFDKEKNVKEKNVKENLESGDGRTVTRREVKPHHFDMKTGKSYIDGEEVPLELYKEFKEMSDEEKLRDPRFSTGDPISPERGIDDSGLKPTSEKKEKGLFGGETTDKKGKGLFGGLFSGGKDKPSKQDGFLGFGGKDKPSKSKYQKLVDAGYKFDDKGMVGGQRIITHTGPEHGQKFSKGIGGMLGIGNIGRYQRGQTGTRTITGKGSGDSLEDIVNRGNLEVPKKRGLLSLMGGAIDSATGNLTDFDQKGGETFGSTRILGGLIDSATGNLTDIDKKGGETFGLTRGITGVADFLTGNKYNLDKKPVDKTRKEIKNEKRGVKGVLGGFADALTGNLTDIDARGGKPLGLTRNITGALDFATANAFDLDQRGGILDGLFSKKKKKKSFSISKKGDLDKRGEFNLFGKGKGKDKGLGEKTGSHYGEDGSVYHHYPLDQPRVKNMAEAQEYLKNNPEAKGRSWVKFGDSYVLQTEEQANQDRERLEKAAEGGSKYAQNLLDFEGSKDNIKPVIESKEKNLSQESLKSLDTSSPQIIMMPGANQESSSKNIISPAEAPQVKEFGLKATESSSSFVQTISNNIVISSKKSKLTGLPPEIAGMLK